MLTATIAAGIAAALVGPHLLEWALSGTGGARLRLAEHARQAHVSGFVNGCGPVRRATARDVREAEDRIARTAWRARIIHRRRDCRERREARRALLLEQRPAAVRPRRRDCTPPPAIAPEVPADVCTPPEPAPSTAAPWPFRYSKPTPRPAGMTPLQAIVAELRG